MSLTPEQIAELQTKADLADQLQQRLDALSGNKGEILDEKKKLQQQLQDLQNKEAERQKKELEQQGKTAELLEHERKEKDELRKQIEEMEKTVKEERERRTQDRLRSDFLAVFNAGEVFQPDHVWAMLNSTVQDKDGKTVALHRGREVEVAELAASLRQDAGFAYLFKPKGSGGGMGSRPSPADPAGASGNPYLAGGSVTTRLALELENPDLAAKLQAEAGAARGKG